MKEVRIGLAGLGEVGKRHFYNCFHLNDARLIAVADTSKKSRLLARKKGIHKVYNEYNELLLDPDIDCAIIALPTHLHVECAKLAMEQKKHILIEKPLARNVQEAKEILSHKKKVQADKVKIMVAYPLRYYKEFTQLKTTIAKGLLGKMVFANLTNSGPGPFYHRMRDSVPKPVPSWWFDKTLTGGGALMDLGSHMINLARWYFGDNVVKVQSFLYNEFNLGFEDHAICLLEFKDGPKVVVNVGWLSQEVKIAVDISGTVRNQTANLSPSSLSSRILKLLTGKSPTDPFYIELEHFISCVKYNKKPLTSAKDALKDLELISQAYKNQISDVKLK